MRKNNKICPFCDKKISTISHLKKCNDSIDEVTSYKLMIEKSFNCSVDDIIKEYLSGLSLPDVKKKYGLSYKMTQKILNDNGYNCRTIKESCNNNRLNKYVKTTIEKYGVDNVSKSDEIKNKKKETFIKNYGVDNIFKTNGFSSYVDLIMLERYGKKRLTNPLLISKKRLEFTDDKWNEINRKTIETYQKRYDNGESINKYKSKLELYIKQSLDELNIVYEQQKYVNGRSYDFYIVNTNILIEVNGDYWHANPKFYNYDDEINYSGGKCLVKEIWDRDRLKKENAEKYGYVIIYLWEWDINECLKSKTINEFLLSNLIYGR